MLVPVFQMECLADPATVFALGRRTLLKMTLPRTAYPHQNTLWQFRRRPNHLRLSVFLFSWLSWFSDQHIFPAIGHRKVAALWNQPGVKTLRPCACENSKHHRIVHLPTFKLVEPHIGQLVTSGIFTVVLNARRTGKTTLAH